MWAVVGTIKLIYFTYQDFKNKMRVDDRYNSFMLGLSFAFLPVLYRNIWYILTIALFSSLFYFFLLRLRVLGKGDVNTLNWIIFGYCLINIYHAAIFLMIFLVAVTLFFTFKLWIFPAIFKIFKIGNPEDWKKRLPFYPVILTVFVISALINGVYLA